MVWGSVAGCAILGGAGGRPASFPSCLWRSPDWAQHVGGAQLLRRRLETASVSQTRPACLCCSGWLGRRDKGDGRSRQAERRFAAVLGRSPHGARAPSPGQSQSQTRWECTYASTPIEILFSCCLLFWRHVAFPNLKVNIRCLRTPDFCWSFIELTHSEHFFFLICLFFPPSSPAGLGGCIRGLSIRNDETNPPVGQSVNLFLASRRCLRVYLDGCPTSESRYNCRGNDSVLVYSGRRTRAADYSLQPFTGNRAQCAHTHRTTVTQNTQNTLSAHEQNIIIHHRFFQFWQNRWLQIMKHGFSFSEAKGI